MSEWTDGILRDVRLDEVEVSAPERKALAWLEQIVEDSNGLARLAPGGYVMIRYKQVELSVDVGDSIIARAEGDHHLRLEIMMPDGRARRPCVLGDENLPVVDSLVCLVLFALSGWPVHQAPEMRGLHLSLRVANENYRAAKRTAELNAGRDAALARRRAELETAAAIFVDEHWRAVAALVGGDARLEPVAAPFHEALCRAARDRSHLTSHLLSAGLRLAEDLEEADVSEWDIQQALLPFFGAFNRLTLNAHEREVRGGAGGAILRAHFQHAGFIRSLSTP